MKFVRLIVLVVLIPAGCITFSYVHHEVFVHPFEQWELDSSRYTLSSHFENIIKIEGVKWYLGGYTCSFRKVKISQLAENEVLQMQKDGSYRLKINEKKEMIGWRKTPILGRINNSRRIFCGDFTQCFSARPGRSKYNLLKRSSEEGLFYSDWYCGLSIIDLQKGEYVTIARTRRK